MLLLWDEQSHVLRHAYLDAAAVQSSSTGTDMFIAIFRNYFRAGNGNVSKGTSAGVLLQGFEHFFRKTMRIRGQRIFRNHTRQFSVSNVGILSHRRLRQTGRYHAANTAQTSLNHIRNPTFR